MVRSRIPNSLRSAPPVTAPPASMVVDPIVVLDAKSSVEPVMMLAPLSPSNVPNRAAPLVSMLMNPAAAMLLSVPVRLAAVMLISSAESIAPSETVPPASSKILAPDGALLFWLPPRPVVVNRPMRMSPSASMLLVPPLVNVPMVVLPPLVETKASATTPRSTRMLPMASTNADPASTVSDPSVMSLSAWKKALLPLDAVVMAMPP